MSSSSTIAENDEGITIKGKKSDIYLNKYILISDATTYHVSLTIKNIGNAPTKIYLGYATFSDHGTRLGFKNYPYDSSNTVLSVVASDIEDGTIIVDSLPKWAENCSLALNAKNDLSDIPSTLILDAKIKSVKQISDGAVEIKVDHPLKRIIAEGTKVRVHGSGGETLYTNRKVLQPGEEVSLSSSLSRDISSLLFSPEAFSRGVYYVTPIMLSYSLNSNEENTILIKEYSLSF